MPLHHRHLPTFVYTWHFLRDWYRTAAFWQRFLVQLVLGLIFVWIIYFIFAAPPSGFPAGAYVTVGEGDSLTDIATGFKERGLVTSASVLEASARIVGSDRHIPAGVYYFPRPENAIFIAIRLITGDFEITPIKVTVPEGTTVDKISLL